MIGVTLTDQTHAELSAQLLTTALDRNPGGVMLMMLTDPSNIGSLRIDYVNAGASAASGADMNQFVGQTLEQAFPALMETDLPALYRRAFDTGQPQVVEITYGDDIVAHGVYRVTANAITQHHLAIYYTNITEERESNSRMRQFASVAAHDLKEPLRKLAGFSKLLDERFADETDEEVEYWTRSIRSGSERMAEIIDGLMDFSSVSSDDLVFERVNLTELINQVTTLLGGRIKAAGTRIVTDSLPDVVASRVGMERLFHNLIANAVKFSSHENKPRVAITLQESSSPDMVCIQVEDNGTGFDTDFGDQIFEFGRRLHTRDEFTGSGIGLAICQRIVQRHGGTISADATVGEGARFTITLPKARI